MIVLPYPRLAGNNNNKRTLNVVTAVAALHIHLLYPKKANRSVIIVIAVLESFFRFILYWIT